MNKFITIHMNDGTIFSVSFNQFYAASSDEAFLNITDNYLINKDNISYIKNYNNLHEVPVSGTINLINNS